MRVHKIIDYIIVVGFRNTRVEIGGKCYPSDVRTIPVGDLPPSLTCSSVCRTSDLYLEGCAFSAIRPTTVNRHFFVNMVNNYVMKYMVIKYVCRGFK